MIESRLAWAEAVRQRTIDDHAGAWRNAIEGIRAHPHYDGLDLSPQVGLIPLGENPQSGLWEFWHPRSAATDELPAVGPDGAVRVTEDSGIVFVLIPPGVQDESGRSVPPFLLAKHELTQAQFDRLGASPSPSVYTRERFGQYVTDRTHPAEGFTWRHARRLLRAHGLRLPNSVEWEHACRAGTSGRRYTGTSPNSVRGHANIAGPKTAKAINVAGARWDDDFLVHAPVGSFLPSPFGLYDMFGNVAEMCDVYDLPYRMSGDAEDSTVCEDRGGDWSSHPRLCRADHSLFSRADWAKPHVGVRPARSLFR